MVAMASEERYEQQSFTTGGRMSLNPILTTPHNSPVPWSTITPQHFEEATNVAAEEAKIALQRIINVQGERTIEDTLIPFDRLMWQWDRIVMIGQALKDIAGREEFKDSVTHALGDFNTFNDGLYRTIELYNALTTTSESDKRVRATPLYSEFIDRETAKFRKLGIILAIQATNGSLEQQERASQKLARLEAIENERAVAQGEFIDRYVQHRAASTFEVDDYDAIKNVSEDMRTTALEAFIEANPDHDIEKSPRWLFNLADHEPELLNNSEDSTLKNNVWLSRFRFGLEDGEFDLRPMMAQILALRDQKAEQLGYGNYADLKLDGTKFKDSEGLRKFLVDAADQLRAKFDNDKKVLEDYASTCIGEFEGKSFATISPSEIRFIENNFGGSQFGKVPDAPNYFELDETLNRIAWIVDREEFGVRYEEDPTIPSLTPSTRSFRLYDEDGTQRAIVQFNLSKDENKRAGGAATYQIAAGISDEPEGQLHHLVVTAALAPNRDGKVLIPVDKLMKTIFHERFHVLGGGLSSAPLFSLSGLNLPASFLEAHATFGEKLLDGPMLQALSKHHENGSSLTAEEANNLYHSQIELGRVRNQMRQIGLAMVDLELHTRKDLTAENIAIVARETMEPFLMISAPEKCSEVGFFHHLWTDERYAAEYGAYISGDVQSTLWHNIMMKDFSGLGHGFGRWMKEEVFVNGRPLHA